MNELVLVVVLFNCELKKSKTLNSLIDSFKKFQEDNLKASKKITLIIYDNSKTKLKTLNFEAPIKFIYFHDSNNSGLAKAYNHSLNYAIRNKSRWLTLLDQDSILPENYLSQLSLEILKVKESCVAIVPKVLSNNKLLSPCKVLFWGSLRPLDINFYGKNHREVFAIGSGVTVSVSYLKKINGFNEFFWLDSLDRWLFNSIKNNNFNVWISNIKINHELSITNYDQLVTETRYLNIMKYESFFIKNYRNKAEFYFYRIRLLKRFFYLLFFVKNKAFAKMTLVHLLGKKIF